MSHETCDTYWSADNKDYYLYVEGQEYENLKTKFIEGVARLVYEGVCTFIKTMYNEDGSINTKTFAYHNNKEYVHFRITDRIEILYFEDDTSEDTIEVFVENLVKVDLYEKDAFRLIFTTTILKQFDENLGVVKAEVQK